MAMYAEPNAMLRHVPRRMVMHLVQSRAEQPIKATRCCADPTSDLLSSFLPQTPWKSAGLAAPVVFAVLAVLPKCICFVAATSHMFPHHINRLAPSLGHDARQPQKPHPTPNKPSPARSFPSPFFGASLPIPPTSPFKCLAPTKPRLSCLRLSPFFCQRAWPGSSTLFSTKISTMADELSTFRSMTVSSAIISMNALMTKCPASKSRPAAIFPLACISSWLPISNAPGTTGATFALRTTRKISPRTSTSWPARRFPSPGSARA
ncbi:uncharacterized protein BJ171DRAFT_205052 [Polychytrium aggregatum]|uniref:uncharacterized protein n=1 Tax=Polychytrium aggregatum TaxID=110093 RepID=UPI0022FEEA34|nr:uncharacterized protein BJ171DRAFT_205052 [Polychytrium aggregatum]KAI9199611.1 hypothetical protein BJ171DRAFT_205052 [Polychytrium aggregatum]